MGGVVCVCVNVVVVVGGRRGAARGWATLSTPQLAHPGC